MNQLGKILKDDEEIIQEVRQHLIVFGWPMIISLMLFLVPFFLLYPLFGLGEWGVAIFGLMLILGIFLAIKTFVIWYGNSTVLTNKRIIFFSKRGLLDKKILNVELEVIDDVILHTQGFLATVLKYDNLKLTIVRQSVVKKKWLYCIPDGASFREKILEMVKISKEKKEPVLYTAESILEKTPMVELFKALRQVRISLGEEKFNEILNKEE
ncbi:MAG: hypothetical protein WCX88_01530 [Patescibacteria group bacterium]